MRFDINDLADSRVVDSSFERYYPADVDESPADAEGVYVFTDKAAEVLFIGNAAGGGLKKEIAARRNTSADRDSKRFRWVCTKTEDDAKTLASEWIEKYKPKNNS